MKSERKSAGSGRPNGMGIQQTDLTPADVRSVDFACIGLGYQYPHPPGSNSQCVDCADYNEDQQK